jgi:hypothetical protein
MRGKIPTVKRCPATPVSAAPNEAASKAESKERDMGEVRTEVTLVNIRDAANAQSGFIPESELRRLKSGSIPAKS